MTKDDLISRQAAIDAIGRLDIPEDMCVFEILSHIELEIGNLPSAQPERKKGKWIKADSQQYFRKHYPCFTCSECGYRKDSQKKWNYCPNCGARMDGEVEGRKK